MREDLFLPCVRDSEKKAVAFSVVLATHVKFSILIVHGWSRQLFLSISAWTEPFSPIQIRENDSVIWLLWWVGKAEYIWYETRGYWYNLSLFHAVKVISEVKQLWIHSLRARSSWSTSALLFAAPAACSRRLGEFKAFVPAQQRVTERTFHLFHFFAKLKIFSYYFSAQFWVRWASES